MKWLVNKQLYSEGYPTLFLRVCPLNYIGGLSTIFLGACPLNYISEGCPIYTDFRRMSNEYQKQKSFVLKKKILYMENSCVRESVRTRDMGHGR